MRRTVYTRAKHDHGRTVTAAGHASPSTDDPSQADRTARWFERVGDKWVKMSNAAFDVQTVAQRSRVSPSTSEHGCRCSSLDPRPVDGIRKDAAISRRAREGQYTGSALAASHVE